jgi:hypothetical protein
MSNSLLTPTKIIREALMVAHQRSNFVSTLENKYENEFGVNGAKIGDTCQVRLPNKFTSTASATLNVQDVTESKVDVVVNTRRHIGMAFTTKDLTLTIDDFSKRYIKPAVSQLMADVEYDTIANLYKGVYNRVAPATATSALDLATIGAARRKLVENLAPDDGNWFANLMPRQTSDLIDAGKALFHSSSEIDKQYKKGMVGMTAGFKFFENTLWPRHVQGAANTSYTVDTRTSAMPVVSPWTAISSFTVASGSGIALAGDVFTIADVYRVHPESRVSTGELQQFVLTANTVSGAGTWSFSPAIVTGGAKQNVTIPSTSATAAISITTASKNYDNSLAYHPQFAAFVAPPLDLPGTNFEARETMDGISMRIVKDYDITNDRIISRIDIQYGSALLRPEWAVRIKSREDA